jgi:hypothetical protein
MCFGDSSIWLLVICLSGVSEAMMMARHAGRQMVRVMGYAVVPIL